VRVKAARDADQEGLAMAWLEWERGAASWLRAECLGITMEEATTKRTEAEEAQAAMASAFYAAQSK
jgi:hypothetical protein